VCYGKKQDSDRLLRGKKLVAGAGFEPVRPQPEQLPDYELLWCKPEIV
jgi:hypothetical protein